jgi:hypothetical protein
MRSNREDKILVGSRIRDYVLPRDAYRMTRESSQAGALRETPGRI